jgi:hypothetical protein
VTRALIAIALVFCACGGGGGNHATDAGDALFIATFRDFSNYTKWTSYPITDTTAQAASHPAGNSVVYLNHRPPHGSTTFPIGTIIVKDMPSAARTFAMAKRGQDYNDTGAVNWEWFELQDPITDPVTIVWRGLGPPAGEGYGGAGNTDCNNCHTGAWENDFVQSAPLQLSNF